MADRSVVLRFLSDTVGLKKGFSEVSTGAGETETVFGRLEGKLSGIGSSGIAAAAGFAGVATSVVAFATEAVKRLGEEQVAAAQTAAAIMSTGGAAQVTAGHVGTLATTLAKLSGVDDEVIQGGENLLLTFTNIQNKVGAGNDVFDQATKAALNMSVALGEDMSAASMQLGKALNDPIGGMIALHRVGVQFTDDQKKAISAFVQSGDTMSAQKVILAELNKEFGGSAEAYGKTLPGAIGKAKTAIENWSADVARKAMPAVQTLIGGIGDLGKAVGPTLVGGLEKIGGVFVSVGKFAKDHAGFVIAAAAAYTAYLIPALVTTVYEFAALQVEKVTIVLGLMIGKVVELAGSMGVLNLALTAGGAIVGVAALGAFIQSLVSAKAAAKAMYDEIDKHHDLTTITGTQGALEDTYAELAKNQALLGQYHNPIKAGIAGLYETLTPAKNSIADYSSLVSQGEAKSAELEATLARMQETVGTVGKEFGISGAAVEAYAKTNNIDLTGAVADTTQKLEDQYRATLEATKGWTGYGVSMEDAVQIQKDVTTAFEQAADPVKEYATALTAAQDAAKTGSKATADQIRTQAKAQKDAVTSRHDAEKAALDGEFITGKASQAAHDQRVKNLDAQQKVENDAADATVTSEGKRADAIEATQVKTTLSMAEYQKAVADNTKSTLAWMTNLALIGSRPGGAALEGQLAALGPAQAGLVAQVLKSSPKAFATFATTMAAAGKTATDATALELNKLPGEVQTIANTSGQTFADTLVHQVALGLKPLSTIVTTAANDAITAANTAMAAYYAGLAHDRPPTGPSDPWTPGPTAGPPTPTPGATIPQPTQGPVPYPSSTPPVYALPGFGVPTTHAEGHIAQIARAGDVRIWAEPETGGEAYIPLAMSKRAGSMTLLSQVAGQFGQRLVPMAAGGMWGVPVYGGGQSAASAGVSQADMARLLGALEQSAKRRPAQVGPIVFNEKVDPLHVGRQILWSLS
jgi:hypothetical protein